MTKFVTPRNGLRAFCLILLMASAAVVYLDWPGDQPETGSSPAYWQSAVWIGVYPAGSFQAIPMLTAPTLDLTAEPGGAWKGDFVFQFGRSLTSAEAKGQFSLVLPKGASVGERCLCTGVRVGSPYLAGSRDEYPVLVTDPKHVASKAVFISVRWKDPLPASQKLGLGNVRREVFLSSTDKDGGRYDYWFPFYSVVGRRTGQPVAQSSVIINASDPSVAVSPVSPSPNALLTFTDGLSYVIPSYSSPASNNADEGDLYETITFDMVNQREMQLVTFIRDALFLILGFALAEAATIATRFARGRANNSPDESWPD